MLFTVIPTFFSDNNAINYNSISNHIQCQINKGIKNIVILGTTSEAPTISINEKIKIVHMIRDTFSDSINLVIGINGNNTIEVLNEAKLFQPFADYLMISAPYYNKPTQEGLYKHFKFLDDSISKNIILYNVPSRCGVNIEPTTIASLYNDCKKIVAIKEASGSIEQVIKIKKLCNIKIYCGDDALIIPFMSLGAEGLISVISNVIPSEMNYIINNYKNGNTKDALDLFYKVYDLIKLAFIESNPIPIKYMIYKLNNLISYKMRLPLTELSENSKVEIDNYIANNSFIELTTIS
jgi:4-hydroxy-tetrahydrodipicolinate synthase